MKNQKLLQASNIFFAVGVATLIICINIAILNLILPPLSGWTIYEKSVSWKTIVRGITIAPLLEEFVFRYLPITLAAKSLWFKDSKENQYLFIGLIACLFGYMHGNMHNILIQGVAGFAFGWVYLKNGMSYWSAVLAHFLYNTMVYIVFPIII